MVSENEYHRRFRGLSHKETAQSRLALLSQNPAYTNAVLVDLLQGQNMFPRFTLWTDVDGTLTYKPFLNEDIEIVADKKQRARIANGYIAAYSKRDSIPVIGITGRGIDETKKGIESGDENLPPFAVIAPSLGAERFVRQKNGEYLKDMVYDEWIRNDLGFVRRHVYPVCVEFLWAMQNYYGDDFRFQDRDTLENYVADSFGLPSPFPPPQDYKISYHFNESSLERAQRVARLLKTTLRDAGFPNIQSVLSHTKDLEGGVTQYNLDVVPLTKEAAVEKMAEDFYTGGLASGDSGNDSGMIHSATFAGLIVGGAKHDLIYSVDGLETKQFASMRRTKVSQQSPRLIFIDDTKRVASESIVAIWTPAITLGRSIH